MLGCTMGWWKSMQFPLSGLFHWAHMHTRHIHSALSADADMGEHPRSRNRAHIEPSIFILFVTSRLHNLELVDQISERMQNSCVGPGCCGFSGSRCSAGQLAQAKRSKRAEMAFSPWFHCARPLRIGCMRMRTMFQTSKSPRGSWAQR